MNSYIVCPKRKEKKVDLQICIGNCELKHSCDEFREVPKETLVEVLKKLGLPTTHLKELEKVIDVEGEKVADGALIPSENCTSVQKSINKNCTEISNLSASESFNVRDTDKNEPAMAMYEKALLLKKDIEAKFLEMGAVLNEIYDHKYYLDVGYQDWKQFCDEALDIKWRWALYVRAAYLKKIQLNISDEDCSDIGIKKLVEILPVIKDRKSADHWIKEAKKPGMTTERLNAKVRLARGRITEEEAARVPMKVFIPLYEGQKEVWDRAFELAGKILGSDKKGVQAEMIAAEFLSTYEQPDEEWPRARIAAAWLTMLERVQSDLRMKFSIEVTDLETGEIFLKTS